MRNLLSVAIVALLGASLLPVPVSGQAADPWIGTWTLNVAKSKYSPGPAPKSGALTIAASAGGGIHQTVDTVPATGAPIKWEITANFDGKDYPVKGNNPNSEMQSYKKIDARTYEVAAKRGGKPTLTTRVTISADGKTRTSTQTGTDAQGQKVNNVIVYERK